MQKYEWLGTRKKDNFSYTKGEIPIYYSDCKNSIIISDLKEGIIKGISNYALINNQGKSNLIPITAVDEIINFSEKMLGEERVFYKKPKSIFDIQNLENISKEEIKQKIFENYNLEVDNLFEIKTKKGDNRVYKVVSKKIENLC